VKTAQITGTTRLAVTTQLAKIKEISGNDTISTVSTGSTDNRNGGGMSAQSNTIAAVRIAAAAADRLKATDIVAFDVSNLLGITEIMLIVTASNERQVLGVGQEIEKDLYLHAEKLQPREREGLAEAQWVLLDYGDFVVHIMHEEARAYYGLERLWKDCPQIDLELPATPQEANDTNDAPEMREAQD
jgi:ribosome-associated protein